MTREGTATSLLPLKDDDDPSVIDQLDDAVLAPEADDTTLVATGFPSYAPEQAICKVVARWLGERAHEWPPEVIAHSSNVCSAVFTADNLLASRLEGKTHPTPLGPITVQRREPDTPLPSRQPLRRDPSEESFLRLFPPAQPGLTPIPEDPANDLADVTIEHKGNGEVSGSGAFPPARPDDRPDSGKEGDMLRSEPDVSGPRVPLDVKVAQQINDATPQNRPTPSQSPVNGPATTGHEVNKDVDSVQDPNDAPQTDPPSSLDPADVSDNSGSSTPSSPDRKAGIDSNGDLGSSNATPLTPNTPLAHSQSVLHQSRKRPRNSPGTTQNPKASRFDSPKKHEEKQNPDSEITNCSGNAVEKALTTDGVKVGEAVSEVDVDGDDALAHGQGKVAGKRAGAVPDRGSESSMQAPDNERDQAPAIIPEQITTGDQEALTSNLADSGDPPPSTTAQLKSTESPLPQSQS